MTDDRRIRMALESAADALEQAAGQAERSDWRWAAVALCAGLKASCVAALSAYPTAQDADILAPDNHERIASLQTLLRRAGDARYLADPERLSGKAAAIRDALALQAVRNTVIHIAPSSRPADVSTVEALIPGTLDILSHLLLVHPAFDPGTHSALGHRCEVALARLAGEKR